ncbi:hypothetical protein FPHYL_13981, partial [Fusarium phyllophilum]
LKGGTLKSDQPLANPKRRAFKASAVAVAQQVLGLFQHVHGNKGFGVPGLDDPANEPAVAPITKYNNPAPGDYQKAPKFQSKAGQSVEPEPTPTSAKVAWTAGQNKLVDDAARQASEACPDKVIARVLPWKREFANLQRVTDAEPAVTQIEGHSLASNVDLAMAHHLDAFRARQFENSHPVPLSLLAASRKLTSKLGRRLSQPGTRRRKTILRLP